MSNVSRMQRIRNHVVSMLGLRMTHFASVAERSAHVRTSSLIGLVVGALFGLFNVLTPGMQTLGLVEWAAVAVLILPAAVLARGDRYVFLCETLMLAAAAVIFGALIVLGGVEGTGMFWVYAAPFIAFFLKGQRQGWWYSMGFIALMLAYFGVRSPEWSAVYPYSPVVALQFLLSLCFYTVFAANMNLQRSRFEEKLHQRVHEKTEDAQKLLGQMQFLATHDTVTGLPNRTHLLEQLPIEMAAAKAAGHGLVVCTLRLERLFEIGNVLGHDGADSLVRHVSVHLSDIVQGHGLLARMRRDEFAMVYRLDTPSIRAETIGSFITGRQFSVQEQGFSLYVELTLGLALYPDHSVNASELLSKADQAMLQAHKNAQQWSVYDAQQEQVFRRHHLLFGKLREAVLGEQLIMYFQPQIDLKTGRVIGAEALVRWPDPVEGMIPPVVFIPVAEESGLIRPLTTWVIGACMRECARWHELGLVMDVSINLSAMNLLDPELLSVLQKGLMESGLQPHFVNLEITESCFMDSPKRAMEVIQCIHEAGFKLSIDDFGTGYSSLSYLKNLPIDELKIDQSFVRKLLETPGDQAIVESTIALAHNFSLQVVAEGIEDLPTAHWLLAHGCDIGQGYTYAKPMPSQDLIAFAQARGVRASGADKGLSA